MSSNVARRGVRREIGRGPTERSSISRTLKARGNVIDRQVACGKLPKGRRDLLLHSVDLSSDAESLLIFSKSRRRVANNGAHLENYNSTQAQTSRH